MLALNSRCRIRSLSIAALLWAIPASAEDPTDPPDPDIEKILITGERQSTLQDVPTSSTSFTAGDLQSLRIGDIADLADFTPNLEINTAFAASNPTIFIRGIGLKDYNANAAGAVAVYQDGININSPAIQLGQLFDVDGIDVLRGPQGSVNGRNATAGAIAIRSAMPDGEFGVSTSLTYGNYNDREIEAAINIPLIKDMLSMRVAGTLQLRDGYTKNQCAGWDPTRYGFRAVGEEATRSVYESLMPFGTYVDGNGGDWEEGDGQLRLVDVDGKKIKKGFVYLEHSLAQRESKALSGITVQPKQNPIRLAEDLRDINGELLWADEAKTIPIGRIGDPVGVMAGTLDFRLDTVDGICITQSPGKIATLFGEATHAGGPAADEWRAGVWRPEYGQPDVADFAKLKRWTNNVDNWAARLVLLFEPSDNMEWMLNVHGTQNRSDSFHSQMLGATSGFRRLRFFESHEAGFSENLAANLGLLAGIGDLGEGTRHVDGIFPLFGPGEGGGNPFSGFYSSDGIEFIDAWGINGWGKWDLDSIVITLLYDYEWYDRVVEDEGDANPNRVFPAIWFDSAWQTNEEIRIEGDGERYEWIAGFFFLHEELDATNFFPQIRQFRIDQSFAQTLTSWAPYARGEIELVEEGVIPGVNGLTLGAGLRFTRETKEFALASTAVGTTSGAEVTEIPVDILEATWNEWTGDVQLNYTPFSNEYGTLISYLKYSHGFKGGHFNASLTIAGGDEISQLIEPVEPEIIDAVEFGIKSRWFDDRVTLDAAFFRYWYQDLQVFDISNDVGQLPIKKLLNGDAKVRGAEAELRVEPVPGLRISANMGWLESEFEEFVVVKDGYFFNYEGNTLVSAPTWSFALIAEYGVSLFGWGSLVPQWTFNYRSKTYLDPQMTDPISQDAYGLHNARIAYRTPGDRIELAFWVANLFAEEYKIDAFDLSRGNNTIREIWGEPRTYGVTLSLNW